MVMNISPSFQFFSNYFKSAWDFLSNHHTHNNKNHQQFFETININNNNNKNNNVCNSSVINDNSIIEMSYINNNVNSGNVYNNTNNENIDNLLFEEFHNNNIENNNNNNNNKEGIIESDNSINEIFKEEKELLSLVENNKEITQSNFYIYKVLSWFWGETICVDHRILGRYFGLSNKDLCYMERLFLNGINFELYTNKNQIIEFLNSIEKEKENFALEGQVL
ncbi:hypothetical protein DICPUDRAFT_150062 [Dictyostelium purpureum]|uniref:Uncharacterized protein n=1 Tax=Dictyostelium purpureum TaxID=5786 RepID=F0ZFD0_DICPU|nr:uncharacterized protein DICPUDRAFT_150062 [Dictyostelium purpureum]EGC37363.1 hypothetical protein DICPUDRAFT_150062 [Dictyostelium purpureum]|eukprot:XP_003286104.1 hypothetical protein DICPUDRAFT_150062 [Dictyostelium purpureum]